MRTDFSNSTAIYIQIMEEIKLRIISGVFKPGDKLPSVRDMAQEFGVNPNTMQRAMSELEREGLVYSERTSGRFITDDRRKIMVIRDALANEELERFILYMKKIGYSVDEIIDKIKKFDERVVNHV